MTDPLRVAIVGAGPAGIYAADALTAERSDVSVDLIDRLPTPLGLLRYGVAPDHVKMKSLEAGLQRVLDRPSVRFFGNVEFGRDVQRHDLLAMYHAIVYASGAEGERRLQIPGEDLPGSSAARRFVAWYNSHPDATFEDGPLSANAVAIVGAGNVALDVARVLARPADEFAKTDVAEHVLHALRKSAVQDIYILVRGGAERVKFTSKELRELGDLKDVDLYVDPAGMVLDSKAQALLDADANAARNIATFREWAARPRSGARRRIHFLFGVRPVAVLGDARVTAVRLERSASAGPTWDLPVQWLMRSVGYQGVALPGVPFAPDLRIIANRSGRVLGEDGMPGEREYVTGWARRGPLGVLGTNKSDALEVAQALLASKPVELVASSDLLDLLMARRVEFVDLSGWARVKKAERALGARLGRASCKLACVEDLLSAARSPAADMAECSA